MSDPYLLLRRGKRRAATLSVAALLVSAIVSGCRDAPGDPGIPFGGIVLQGGVADEFDASNAETATLHPDFRAFLQTRENPIEPNFDGITSNRHFGHSFILPECDGERTVRSARLTMRLRALSGDGSTDQTHWYIRNDLGELEHAWGALIPRDLSGGSWSSGETRIFEFDLGAMPHGGVNSHENLLPLLKNGELHVHVQDDTSIDYIKLEAIVGCECEDPNLEF